MLLEEPFTEIYKFGNFRLEVAERRLFRDGEPVLLTPKAFDVLVILVRNDGKLVTKQELLNQVWPNMVVEEANLANNISLLRKTLGSIPADEPLIETVPRHGYRFRGNVTLVSQPLPPRPFMIERYTVMEVQTEEIETPTGESEVFPVIDLPPDSPDPRLSEPGQTRDFIQASPAPKLIESPDQSGTTSGAKAGTGLGLYRWPLVTVFGIIMVSFGYFGFYSSEQKTVTSLPPPRILPVTNQSGEKLNPSFSPDGKQIAYAWDKYETENFDIYITQIGSLTPKQITDSPLKEFRPVWSPDGKYLAFLRGPENGLELIIKSLDTNSERSFGRVAGGLAWSQDGQYLAVQDQLSPESPTTIVFLEIATGKRQPVTQPVAPWNDMRPVFSPNGRQLAFLRRQNNHGDIWVVPVTGGTPRQVTFDHRVTDSIAWMPDGKNLIFSSDRAGEFGVWQVSVNGGEPQSVSPISGQCDDIAVSPTQPHLVYHQRSVSSNLWSLKRSSPAAEWSPPTITKAVPITTSTRMNDSPSFSPDGHRLVFSSNETGAAEIWTCDANGDNPTRLTFFNQDIAGTPHWSPDGKSIVFDGGINGVRQIFTMSAQGGTPTVLTDASVPSYLPSWSRDGKWIYFCSVPTGVRQIWKIPSTGGTPIQVTKGGGWECAESTDGRYLYYTKDRAVAGLWQLDLATHTESPIPELAQAGRYRYWAVSQDGIFFATPNASQTLIINFFDFKTRTIKEIMPIRGLILRGPSGLAISPDTTHLIFAQKDQFGSDLILVENFRW